MVESVAACGACIVILLLCAVESSLYVLWLGVVVGVMGEW